MFTQVAENGLGGAGIVNQESGEAFAFFDVGLKGEDVYSAFAERKTAFTESARFVFNGDGKFSRGGHDSGNCTG